VVLHFVTYEVTHVANNGFDRVVPRIPGLSNLRSMQIRHHRLHHARPTASPESCAADRVHFPGAV